MKMKKAAHTKIAPEVLMGIDLSNSFNGGSSEVENWFESVEDGYEFTVKVPGVDIEKITVEVIQNRIMVYYMFPVYQQLKGDGEKFARLIGNFDIPSDGDYERVSASYEGNGRYLKITMPFNEHQKGYRSRVEIER